MAHSCAYIVAVSARELEVGRRVLGEDAPLIVIENAVDTEHWSPRGPGAARPVEPLVICVGRLTEQKGQDRLIKALSHGELWHVRLRLIGDGEKRSYLEELAARTGVAKQVEFLGECDPAPHYRAADVAVIPSRWEGLSLVLLEAMACGCAIIATKDGSSEMLSPAGLEVGGDTDADVVSELAASLRKLLQDEPLRTELGQAARQVAERCYDKAGWTAKYRELWDRVGYLR